MPRSPFFARSAAALLALLTGVVFGQTATTPVPKKPPAAKKSSPAPVPSAKPSSVPNLAFEKYTLPNGLQVILHVDRKLPVVHVNQWFHVGSKNEKPGRTGFAHLFEHEMFEGSKNAPQKYFSYAEQAGANLFEGGVNGTTNNDRTNYFITVPSGSLEFVLWLESDRLATLGEHLTQKNLDEQRAVVKNERRQGLENQPYGRAFSLINENLFPAGHPYSWPVIGSHEDLSAASLEDVQEFFRKYYTPNNLSLVIAGDFDPAEARRLVEKYFGNIPAGPPLDRPERWISSLSGEKVVEASDRVPQERVYLVWPSPPFYAPDDAELDLTSVILTDGLASRLQKALVYDRQLCTDVNAFQNSMEIASFYAIVATARPGASLPEIEQIVTSEVKRLARSGPTPAELSRAQTKWEFQFVSGLERIGGFGGKADLLNSYNTYLGDPGKFEFDQARYRNATVESVRAAVAHWLDTGNLLVVRFHPEKSGRASETALDRSQKPALGADRPFRAPEVQSARLANGLQLFVVERHELPRVAVAVAALAGSVGDPPGRDGTTSLTLQTMPLGTSSRGALEIETALGNLGTSFVTDMHRESARIGFGILRRNLEPGLALLADVVLHATFPTAEVEREEKRRLDMLAQQADSANEVSRRVGPMLSFGREHPYGRAVDGLPETVRPITRDDLVAFYRARWKPGGAALVFVGDVTLDDARRLADASFGAWSGGAPESVAIPAASPSPARIVYVVDRQDAAQTVIRQLLPAPKRQSPDFAALTLADAVWGGSASSRLDMNLREDKGYSYGVFSSLTLFREGGEWIALGGVQTNKTKESVAEFDKELKAIGGGRPITPEEFEFQKARILRGYAQGFETESQVAQQVMDLWALGLPMSELQGEYDEIAKTTPDQARAATTTWAKPDAARLLLVGDWAKIGPGLKELGVEVVMLDDEGKPKGR
jgi:zinc protease